MSFRYDVDIYGDDYDFELECWNPEENGMLLILSKSFDTLGEAVGFCEGITPEQAVAWENEGGYNGLWIHLYETPLNEDGTPNYEGGRELCDYEWITDKRNW